MQDQTLEETQEETPTEPETETQEESLEETSEETAGKENHKTPESIDYEKKFKESQKEALRLKKEYDELRKKKDSNPTSHTDQPFDIDSILEVQQATKDLSPEAIEELRLRAKINNKSLLEARKDENFILWNNAFKEKVAREKTISPSTKQSVTPKRKSLAEMTLEEKEAALIEMGSSASFAKAAKWKK
jgi:hypothetical protein